MSGTFNFSSDFFFGAAALDWRQMSTGDSTGLVNNSAHFSVVSNTQLIDSPLDKDMFAIALVAGQTVTFEVDRGGNDALPVDTEINIVDATGALVVSDDDSASLDAGSSSTVDPLLTFTAATSGIYYITVADYRTDYLNGSFTFDGGTAATGDYRFVASTSFLPALVTYGPGVDNLTLGNLPDRIDLGAGDDIANLGGGNDIAYGGSGLDTINGGDGDDVLDGESNADTVNGGNGYDVITVLSAGDRSFGGEGKDQLLVFNGAGCLADGQAGDDIIVVSVGTGGTLAGGTGVDTLSLLDTGVAVTIDLTTNATGGSLAGTTISGFENVIGGLAIDTLTGSSLANKLQGGAGADQLYGRSGDDILIGGLGGDGMDGEGGIDTADYSLSGAAVTVNLLANVHSGGDAAGDFLLNIENVTGSAAGDTLTGNNLANVLNGGDGSDFLDGGLGNDTMIGGDGGDNYFVRSGGDVIVETGASGFIDTVRSFLATYTLAATLENLLLDFAGNANGTGNASANLIFGNAFNNIIDGKAGADDLRGGSGNDSYYLDTAADAVFELPNDGTDTIYASFSADLGVESPEVENLVLLGSSNINGSGNALSNVIIGNDGSNILNGLGGNDAMAGGKGNDTYYFDSGFDVAAESFNEGIDIVRYSSGGSVTLGANIEKLYLLGSASGAFGNGLSNFIYGNALSNVIDGGAGADRLYGGNGNDEYYLDSAGDLVFETTAGAAGGSDTVHTSVNHTLGTNFENLELLGVGNINGTGNTQANFITGNSGNNFIDGKGASDSLTGGAGLDTFLFSTARGASNIDTISDFTVADDTIRLGKAVFAALPVGYLAVAAFHTGFSAADASDRIIYNSATGALFYDADGLGGVAQVQFAVLSAGLALTNAEFFVF
jgi:serralysin